MSTKIQQESQWLSEKILPIILKNGKLIENYREDNLESFKVHNIEINFIGSDEAFCLTTCYRARIEFEYANNVNVSQMVVKKTPAIPDEMYDSVCFDALYNNEIVAYTVIIPAIETFTEEKMELPKFYYSDRQRNCAAIVLDDFTVRGFRMSKDKVNLSLEHALLAVEYLGRFHGYGFALKQVDRQLFDIISSSLIEARFTDKPLHPDWALTLDNSVHRMVKATKAHENDLDGAFLDKLAAHLKDVIAYSLQLIKPVEPMVTLCHGDYLRNNVAYKYKEGTETPVEIMMFDLQTMRIGSPMMDLVVFLSLSTFAEVRYTHFTQIFNAYSAALAKAYETHAKVPLPDYLSNESLLKEYIRFAPYGLNVASFFLMNLVEPRQITPEEMLNQQLTPEEVIEDAMTRGGEVVDRELAHQVKELQELSKRLGVDPFEGIVLKS